MLACCLSACLLILPYCCKVSASYRQATVLPVLISTRRLVGWRFAIFPESTVRYGTCNFVRIGIDFGNSQEHPDPRNRKVLLPFPKINSYSQIILHFWQNSNTKPAKNTKTTTQTHHSMFSLFEELQLWCRSH